MLMAATLDLTGDLKHSVMPPVGEIPTGRAASPHRAPPCGTPRSPPGSGTRSRGADIQVAVGGWRQSSTWWGSPQTGHLKLTTTSAYPGSTPCPFGQRLMRRVLRLPLFEPLPAFAMPTPHDAIDGSMRLETSAGAVQLRCSRQPRECGFVRFPGGVNPHSLREIPQGGTAFRCSTSARPPPGPRSRRPPRSSRRRARSSRPPRRPTRPLRSRWRRCPARPRAARPPPAP
jgi:hypothetical protein